MWTLDRGEIGVVGPFEEVFPVDLHYAVAQNPRARVAEAFVARGGLGDGVFLQREEPPRRAAKDRDARPERKRLVHVVRHEDYRSFAARVAVDRQFGRLESDDRRRRARARGVRALRRPLPAEGETALARADILTFWYNTDMKIDERCLPYAEEMKTCGYCAEGEYLAVFGIKICELDATKLYLFKEQSHRGRVIVASKLHVSEITALSDDERNAFFADVNRVAKALHAVFNPTKVNYGAYGDTGHHLHFHLVPKYAGDEFEWGGVFAMNPKRKFLTDAEYAELVAAIKAAL